MYLLRPETGGDHIELIGIILKGRYCVVDRLGRGGEGSLYLARDLELGLYRAVKELPLEKKREAGLLRLLEHPALPQMIDYTEQNGYCYLVMEYIRGKSLRQYLNEGKAFSGEEILGIAGTILEILDYLHSRKPPVYYGDLKPDNLMMKENGAVCLVDFGSAVLGYERQTFTCLGTKGYAAPEQYQGQISAVSDIFSLGKTLEELCKKRRIQIYLQYPGLILYLWKCCRPQPQKRFKDAAKALAGLKKLRPLSARVWRSAAIGFGAFLAVIFAAGLYMGTQMGRIPFERAFSAATAGCYSMDFRLEGSGVREALLMQMEKSGRRLLYSYQEAGVQRKLLLFLASVSELQGNTANAESYYRELVRNEEAGAEEFAVWGLFLIRQNRIEESRELYREFCKNKMKGSEHSRNYWIWRAKLSKAGGVEKL